jgi:hypothetical protein
MAEEESNREYVINVLFVFAEHKHIMGGLVNLSASFISDH